MKKIAITFTALFLFALSSCTKSNKTIIRMQHIEEGVSSPTSIEELKDAILKYLKEYGDEMTISDMIENIPELEGKSNQYTSALVRALVLSGKVEKTSHHRMTFFKIS